MADIKMLQPHQIADYRAGGCNEQGNTFSKTWASGRATCRCCGKKITKGEICLEGYHDFTGSGSWTSVKCYIHITCPE
jgi:hypothetical protein